MRVWWTLYVKEWKDAFNIFVFLMGALAVLCGYGWVKFEPDFSKVGPGALLGYIPFILAGAACFIAPPFLLARSFSSEWKSDTHYQMFALPVPKFMPALVKYLVAFCNGFAMFLLVTATIFGIAYSYWHDESSIRVAYDDTWFMMLFGYVVYLMLMLGFVTGMEGVKFTVKQYRRLTAVGFWVFSMFCYFWFYGYFIGFLDFLGVFEVDSVMNGQVMMGIAQFAWASFLYPAFFGGCLLVLGLLLFERHVEI